MASRRALHFVFKIGDRKMSLKFFKDILGMKILRHEEFEEGCKATCNGPYDGKWSKTMIGYGSEDKHFVAELTYNYGINLYKLGNDFLGMTIKSKEVIQNAKVQDWPMKEEEKDCYLLESPDGYKFYVLDESVREGEDPVQKVTLASSDLQRSLDFWEDILQMKLYNVDDKSLLLGFSDNQCKLELKRIGENVDHAKAFGRIAFSCPRNDLSSIQSSVERAGNKVIQPLISLDTPGKATVHVVILGDPDGHEICFVGDESFKELSQLDPKADSLLTEAMEKDKSDEWFSKKGLSKAAE